MAYELTFGERLDDLMKKREIDGKALSELTGISTSTISEILNGKRENPTAKNIIELSKVLKVSSDYLLGLIGIESSDPDDKAIHEKTGLSDTSIHTLKAWKKCQDSFDGKKNPFPGYYETKALNYLLEKGISNGYFHGTILGTIGTILFSNFNTGDNNYKITLYESDTRAGMEFAIDDFYLSQLVKIQDIIINYRKEIQGELRKIEHKVMTDNEMLQQVKILNEKFGGEEIKDGNQDAL